MTEKRKAFAAILAVLFVALTILSAVFVAEHTEHECCGEDCPVCEQIAVCERALERLSAAAVAAVIAALTVLAVQGAFCAALASAAAHTPVTLKVKLSD